MATKKEVRLLVVDGDLESVLQLRQLIQADQHIGVVAHAVASLEAIRMASLERPDVVCIDLNSLGTYRRLFGRDSIGDSDGRMFCWRGKPSADPRPGESFTATIYVFVEEGDDRWSRSSTTHWQRHHPRAEVERALELAGLELVATRGQLPGARLEHGPDEERHQKLVYLAKRGR